MLDRLIGVLRTVIGETEPTPDINQDSDIFIDLGLQSLSTISLLVLCEKEFNVELSTKIRLIEDISKVENLLKFIKESGGH